MIFLKYIKIGNNIENASAIALGCMRIHALDNAQVEELIMTALDNGINFLTMLISTEKASLKSFSVSLWQTTRT